MPLLLFSHSHSKIPMSGDIGYDEDSFEVTDGAYKFKLKSPIEIKIGSIRALNFWIQELSRVMPSTKFTQWLAEYAYSSVLYADFELSQVFLHEMEQHESTVIDSAQDPGTYEVFDNVLSRLKTLDKEGCFILI